MRYECSKKMNLCCAQVEYKQYKPVRTRVRILPACNNRINDSAGSGMCNETNLTAEYYVLNKQTFRIFCANLLLLR
jgi:hypothetical protein